MAFHFEQTVLFRHCDPAGIVFYPRYLEMLNDAVEAYFDKQLKFPFSTLHDSAAVPTVNLNIEFKSPGRQGDVLDIAITPKKLGGSSLVLNVHTRCGDQTRFEAEVTLVHVNQDMRPGRWPEHVVTQIEQDLAHVDNIVATLGGR